MKIGERIRQCRLDWQMSELDLAKQMGVEAELVFEWENGKKFPQLSHLPKLSQILDVSIDYLLTGKEFKKSKINDEKISQKAKVMDTLKPEDFLEIRQGGIPVSKADKRLIMYIQKRYKLKDGVMNTLLDYCLTVDDNVLNKTYIEKIAASLARAEVNSASQAMMFIIRKRK